MRILYITASLPFGPVEAFIVDELRQLLCDHEVLILPRSPGTSAPHGAELVSHSRSAGIFSLTVMKAAIQVFLKMPIRTLRSCSILFQSRSPRTFIRNIAVLPKALWISEVATEWKADHIHCHWAGTTATMALIASSLSGIPWSFTAHRSDIVGNNLLHAKAKSASIVRAISQSGKRMLLERGVDVGEKLQVLPVGVRIPSGPCAQSTERVLLCPADLLEVKGHKYLLQAWHYLQEREMGGELWLAGDGHLRPALQELVETLAIEATVKFLGTVPHAELLELYAKGAVSAVVLASINLGHGVHEGIPVALVEAMSYGLPVITTRTGGIPELVTPSTGLLVEACDPRALANAIEQIFLNPHFAQKIGQNGRQLILRTRDVCAVAATLETWFHEATEAKHGVNLPEHVLAHNQ